MPDQQPNERRQNEWLQKRQQQIDKANKDPLNQAALQWLRRTDETISEATQHCLQLMLWGLDSARLGFPNKQQTNMFEVTVIDMAAQANQLDVLRYLQGPPDESNLTEDDLLTAGDKEHAAWLLIDALDRQLQSEPDNNGIYPPQDPLRLPGD